MQRSFVIFGVMILGIWACKKDPESPAQNTPTPYEIPVISNFRPFPIDTENPLTEEGVDLGHRLFFERKLSNDNTLSCAGCHRPENGFSDPRQFSIGTQGIAGSRNAMAIFNLAWSEGFFWDGRAATLREQAILPIEDSIEMHLPLAEAVSRLKAIPAYTQRFEKAFGTQEITPALIGKALEQYMKALISYNSPFDKYKRGEAALSPAAAKGEILFNTEQADCFHCHTTPELMVHASKTFVNNGLDEIDNPNDFIDKGRGKITGNPDDNGKFKVPSLRNLAFTAPYMHDGRFKTLDEVIDFYNEGPKISPSLEPIMIAEANRRLIQFGRYGLGLTPEQKEDLKAFLLSLSDETLRTNPLFNPPVGL